MIFLNLTGTVFRKNPKNSDTRKCFVNTFILKFEQCDFTIKDADGMTNSVDPDQ